MCYFCDQADCYSSNAVDSYLGGAWFDFWLGRLPS
jgi:hypothetical protein